MSERGVAILMSTHTLEVAEEMCDRISIILKGRIIARGTVDELRALAAVTAPATARRRVDVGVSQADGRQRPSGDRRDRLMVRRLSRISCCQASGVAQSRTAAPAWRSDPRRDVWRRRPDRLRRPLSRRVLADRAARKLRGPRRLPVAPRAVVAVSDLSFLPRIQRRRHRAVDFFLSEDLRVLLAAPLPIRRLFHARFVRTVAQASWMVVIFLAPVLMGVGRARCAGAGVLCGCRADDSPVCGDSRCGRVRS